MSLALESPQSLGAHPGHDLSDWNVPVGVMLLPVVSPPHFPLSCRAPSACPGTPRCCGTSGWLGQGREGYLQLPQDGMVLNAGEQDTHGVGPVVQVGDS